MAVDPAAASPSDGESTIEVVQAAASSTTDLARRRTPTVSPPVTGKLPPVICRVGSTFPVVSPTLARPNDSLTRPKEVDYSKVG